MGKENLVTVSVSVNFNVLAVISFSLAQHVT